MTKHQDTEVERCPACSEADLITAREAVQVIGLPGVTAQNVAVSRCPTCGYHETGFERIESLNRAIVAALIRKPSVLVGAEIRFLRGWLGGPHAEFARRMNTAKETLSRWEHGKQPIGGTSERLLRLMVATELGEPYPLARLDTIKTGHHPLRLELAFEDGEWRMADPVRERLLA
jgi:DNA-binding transcriptional regulator YiaG